MAPQTRSRIDPAACLIGDWVPAEYLPLWERSDDHLYQPPVPADATPPTWTFARVVRDFGGERVIAWERVS